MKNLPGMQCDSGEAPSSRGRLLEGAPRPQGISCRRGRWTPRLGVQLEGVSGRASRGAEGVRRSDALLLWLSLCSLRRRASFPASLCLLCLVLCTHMQRMGWGGGARRMPGRGPGRVARRRTLKGSVARGRALHHSNLICWPSLGRAGLAGQ